MRLDITLEETLDCHRILHARYAELGHPLPSKEFFGQIHANMVKGGRVATVLTYFEGQLVGFLWGLIFKDKVFEWYTAFDSSHKDKFVNDRLAWEIMKWGNENGYKCFDFGGAGKPNVPYGVRNFKLQYGGELIEFGRYKKIHKLMLMKLGENGMGYYKRLKQRLAKRHSP